MTNIKSLFIAYARVDLVLVEIFIVNILKAAHYEIWFDHELRAGQNFEEQLLKAIKECDAFVYAITPESLASEWCQWEFAKAVELKKPVIPVMLQKAELPDKLKKIQYVDFTKGAGGEAVAKLVGGLQHLSLDEIPQAPENPKGKPAQAEIDNTVQKVQKNQDINLENLIIAIVALSKQDETDSYIANRKTVLNLLLDINNDKANFLYRLLILEILLRLLIATYKIIENQEFGRLVIIALNFLRNTKLAQAFVGDIDIDYEKFSDKKAKKLEISLKLDTNTELKRQMSELLSILFPLVSLGFVNQFMALTSAQKAIDNIAEKGSFCAMEISKNTSIAKILNSMESFNSGNLEKAQTQLYDLLEETAREI